MSVEETAAEKQYEPDDASNPTNQCNNRKMTVWKKQRKIAMKLARSDTLLSDSNSVSVDINSGVVKSQLETQLGSFHISLWSGTAAETLLH